MYVIHIYSLSFHLKQYLLYQRALEEREKTLKGVDEGGKQHPKAFDSLNDTESCLSRINADSDLLQKKENDRPETVNEQSMSCPSAK